MAGWSHAAQNRNPAHSGHRLSDWSRRVLRAYRLTLSYGLGPQALVRSNLHADGSIFDRAAADPRHRDAWLAFGFAFVPCSVARIQPLAARLVSS